MSAPLHHVLEGAGPTVVLLHAGVADLRMWDAPAAALVAAGQRVLRCDLRGYGETPLAPGAAYSDAEDVLALVDGLGIVDYALVGASYGGYVAQQVATTTPDRVTHLLLLAAAGELAEPDQDLQAFWAEEGRLLEAGDVDGATALNVDTWLGPEAGDEARDLVRRMQHRAFEVQLAAGDVDGRDLPVDPEALAMTATVVVGAHDFQFFRENARLLAERMPAATLVELPWAGHLPTVECPDEGVRLLLDALT